MTPTRADSPTPLDDALDFLESTIAGKRLQVAERTLTLLTHGKLPKVKQFIFNACFDLRAVTDPEQFGKTLPADGRLIQGTERLAFAKADINHDDLTFTLVYEKDGLTKDEALLFSTAFGQVLAATYAALGLDMKGLLAPESLPDAE